jgi:hypothetical protein
MSSWTTFAVKALKVAPLPEETAAQKIVPREELWAIARAARTFLRRASAGSVTSDAYRMASDELERALQRPPVEVWK